jgi:hypothetical protein
VFHGVYKSVVFLDVSSVLGIDTRNISSGGSGIVKMCFHLETITVKVSIMAIM